MKRHLLIPFIAIAIATSATVGRAAPKPPGNKPWKPCAFLPVPVAAGALEKCEKGWHAQGWPQGNPGSYKLGYITFLSNSCYFDDMDSLQCFFTSPTEACNAVVTMNDTIQNNGTKYLSVSFIEDVNETAKKCHFIGVADPGYFVQIDYMNRKARGEKAPAPDASGMTLQAVAVAGPYANQVVGNYEYYGSAQSKPESGFDYNCSVVTNELGKPENLRQLVIRLNKLNNDDKIVSDLAGYPYPKPKKSPCAGVAQRGNPNMCLEPTELLSYPGKPTSAQVHHIIPRKAKSLPNCPWGKNSMKNAAVISAQLNQVLSNQNRPTDEILWINKKMKFTNLVTLP